MPQRREVHVRGLVTIMLMVHACVVVAQEFEDPFPAGFEQDPDSPIPDKMGAELHMSKAERSALKKLECPMCESVIREMHLEVAKHKMTQKGVGSESQVWETSNAICLALLQKYRLDLSATPRLEAKAQDDEELFASGNAGPDFMRHMLVLKMGCQRWLEDYGSDVSGFIYKSVKDELHTADAAAAEFCTKQVSLCGQDKKQKRRREKEKERARRKEREAILSKQEMELEKAQKDDPMSSLPEDSKFGLQRMLEMARDDPLHYMEDDAKARVLQGRSDLRCGVCLETVRYVHDLVAKRPKSMRAELDILAFSESVCEGPKDLSVPSYFGIEPPPLPPVWTDVVRPHLDKASKRWVLKPYGKKAGKKRRKWRHDNDEGRPQPPHAGDSEGDMMMTMACKDTLEPARMAEELYRQMSRCASSVSSGCDAALMAAQAICKEDGRACAFPAPKKGSERSAQEL